MADAREVMNIRQASQYLGISPDTLYKYVSEETIPAFKLGNRWKFKKSILDSWMENQSLSSEPPAPQTGQGRARHGRSRLAFILATDFRAIPTKALIVNSSFLVDSHQPKAAPLHLGR